MAQDEFELTLILKGDAAKEMRDLMNRVEAMSALEVVSMGIRLLSWYLRKRSEGYNIATQRIENEKDVIRVMELDLFSP